MEILEKIKTNIPTRYGKFLAIIYRFEQEEEHLAFVKGELKNQKDVFVRIHSACFTGDIFSSLRCDCGDQLHHALKSIANLKNGLIIYLQQEGRGIGLVNKFKTYTLQDQGFDTCEANEKLGYHADTRNYDVASAMIKDLEINSILLNTNNPDKIRQLNNKGINISKIIPSIMPVNEYNKKYLKTKKEKLKHLLP